MKFASFYLIFNGPGESGPSWEWSGVERSGAQRVEAKNSRFFSFPTFLTTLLRFFRIFRGLVLVVWVLCFPKTMQKHLKNIESGKRGREMLDGRCRGSSLGQGFQPSKTELEQDNFD